MATPKIGEVMDISVKSVPTRLIADIDRIAKVNRRSRNAEIIIFLEGMMKIVHARLAKEGYIILHEDGTHELTAKGKEAVARKMHANA
jgi:Mn-dependent DtxR family transcriptional regulator